MPHANHSSNRLPPPGEGRWLFLGFLLSSVILQLASPELFPFIFLLSFFLFVLPWLAYSIVMEFGINQLIRSDALAIVLGFALVTIAASPWPHTSAESLGFFRPQFSGSTTFEA
jgi:hypothetical protein